MHSRDDLRANLFLDLVLHHILVHDAIVELGGVLECVVIINLALFRLDQVSLLWINNVGDRVVLLA